MIRYWIYLIFLAVVSSASGQANGFNLARLQYAVASSSDDGTIASEAVDGFVSNDSRWYSESGAGPHWLEIQLKTSFTLGSAHLYLGKDDSYTVGNFELQYSNGGGWQTITNVTGNSATDLNVIFPSPVVASKFRLYSTASIVRVKEIALFGENGGAGYPLGTGVNLNLANQRGPMVSSTSSGNLWNLVDGYVDDNSRWLCANNAGPHTMEFTLHSSHEVGSIHLYSGYDSGGSTLSPLAAFDIEYANGSGWVPVSGGTVSSGSISGNSVSGNTSGALVVNLASPVLANRIRLTFTQSYGRIREVVVLPANTTNTGSPGYPAGAGVKIEPEPSTNFKDYHDAWYRLARRGNDSSLVPGVTGSTHASVDTPAEEKHIQLLYVKSLDAYRLRHQASGKCIEVQNASLVAGAPIVLAEAYSAAPHQLWKLVPTSDGYFQFQNVWSGMVIASDDASPVDTASMTQQPLSLAGDPPNTQEWKPKFQDDYFKKGTGGWVGSFNTSWGYDWNRNDDNKGKDFVYTPMQHRQGWPDLGSLHKKYRSWNMKSKASFLLGFNEPDREDQANMSVDKGVELWPRLMAMDVPLVSPACAQGGENWWLNDFMDRHDNKGYRCEYSGGHWYSGPSSDAIMSHIDNIQNQANGRPVWLTEFSVVDWSNGSGNWSEESNYNFILEFLWRAESKNNLKKYAIFIFTGGVPANPWTKSNPRSNFSNGGSLHAFGKAYSGWDGDKTIRFNTPYVLHNRNARHRLRNTGNGTPSPTWIRREDDSAQWLIQNAGGGKMYITSVIDGARLSYDGTTIDFAPAGTTGADVEWRFQQRQYGWHDITHEATGRFLRLHRENDDNNAPTLMEFQMVENASSWQSTDWWFVKPHNPTALNTPAAPSAPVLTPNDGLVEIEFSPIAGNLGYNVYRSEGGGEPVMVAAGVVGQSYTDATAANGTTYSYSYSYQSALDLESSRSGAVAATPRPLGSTFYAVNAGGPAYTANDGTVYEADAYFSFGSSLTDAVFTTFGNTDDNALYLNERNNADATFSYAFPIDNGSYDVILHLAENVYTNPGMRSMSVTLEGESVMSGMDLFAEAGRANAHDQTFMVDVLDGELNMVFSAYSKINAIKVKGHLSPETIMPVYNVWIENMGLTGSPADPENDADGDGQTNMDEFIALTDPDDTSAFFEVDSIQTPEGDEIVIDWISKEGRMYNVSQAANLQTGEYHSVESDIRFPQNSCTVDVSEVESGFLRVDVKLP